MERIAWSPTSKDQIIIFLRKVIVDSELRQGGVCLGNTERSRHKYINIKNNVPGYSGKQMVRGDFPIFSSKRSFLFKKRIIEVSVNHLLLQMESNNFMDSCIRFCWQEKI